MDTLTGDLGDHIGILPPIAGGDGEGEGDEGAIYSSDPAGGDAGSGEPGEGQAEGQPGDEGQAGGDQQQQDDQQQGQGQPGQPGGEFGGAPGGAAPGSVPYSRFKEVNDRLRAVEGERAMLFKRSFEGNGQGQNGGQPARQLPAEYAELDKGMGGYMRHYLDPIAEHLIESREIVSDLRDESRFYRGVGRGLNEQQVDMVERAREQLSQRLRQPIERADALLFLRGHPTHGKLFVDQRAQQQQQLSNGVAAARRQAGAVGGRKPVARTATPGTVDLNSLPRAQRIKVFEGAMGNTPV